MRNAVIALTSVVLALSACGKPNQAGQAGTPPAGTPPAGPPPARPTSPGAVNPPAVVTTYACLDGQTIEAGYPDPQTAVVTYKGHAYTLKAARSGSGARYTGFGLQWWTKGMDQGKIARLKPGEEIASDEGVLCATSPLPGVEPPAPGQPGGLPDDKTPISEAPFTPTSAQGAADVVQTYYALIGEKKYAEAWKLWSGRGEASNQSQADFVASFAKYESYNAQVGAPGLTDGAAGSIFIEVPVVVYARRFSGAEVHESGKVTLRRVNDVDGSTAEQRLWRINRMELKG